MKTNKRQLTTNGIKIRTALAEKNMTQRELTREIGISEGGLMEFMRGRRSGITFYKKIEKILNLKLLI